MYQIESIGGGGRSLRKVSGRSRRNQSNQSNQSNRSNRGKARGRGSRRRGVQKRRLRRSLRRRRPLGGTNPPEGFKEVQVEMKYEVPEVTTSTSYGEHIDGSHYLIIGDDKLHIGDTLERIDVDSGEVRQETIKKKTLKAWIDEQDDNTSFHLKYHTECSPFEEYRYTFICHDAPKEINNRVMFEQSNQSIRSKWVECLNSPDDLFKGGTLVCKKEILQFPAIDMDKSQIAESQEAKMTVFTDKLPIGIDITKEDNGLYKTHVTNIARPEIREKLCDFDVIPIKLEEEDGKKHDPVSFKEMEYGDVIQKIKDTPRPYVLTFQCVNKT